MIRARPSLDTTTAPYGGADITGLLNGIAALWDDLAALDQRIDRAETALLRGAGPGFRHRHPGAPNRSSLPN